MWFVDKLGPAPRNGAPVQKSAPQTRQQSAPAPQPRPAQNAAPRPAPPPEPEPKKKKKGWF